MTAPVGCLDEREAFEAGHVRMTLAAEIMRYVDAYAYDYKAEGKLANSRRGVESAILAALSASRQEGEEWHAVISPSGNEGVMFKSERDAKWTATGLMRTGFGVPVIGDAFRDAYDDTSKFTIVKVCAAAPQQSQEAQGDRHGE
jgi:hypothetical protein